MSEVATIQHEAHDSEEHHGPHVVPLWLLFAVFAALIVLTVLTVAVTYVDLGDANIWIAMGVAFVKAVLVGMYFMHLYWDNPFNSIILVLALLFLALFIGAAMTDSMQYHKNLDPPPSVRALSPVSE